MIETGEVKTKIWYCPSCKEQIGSVVFGQLYLNGTMTVNTDGPNLIVKCPHCEARKIWYAQDRLNILANELADVLIRRMAQSNK